VIMADLGINCLSCGKFTLNKYVCSSKCFCDFKKQCDFDIREGIKQVRADFLSMTKIRVRER
jgi:hypothetical protein